jgi:hypothetical protein
LDSGQERRRRLSWEDQKKNKLSSYSFFYNSFMGAVDLFDQFRQYIKLELIRPRKARKAILGRSEKE